MMVHSESTISAFPQWMDAQVHMSFHEAGRGLRWTSTKRIHPSTVCSVSLGTDAEDGFTVHAFKLVRGGLGKIRAEVCIESHPAIRGTPCVA